MSHRTRYGLLRTFWNFFTKLKPAAENVKHECIGVDKNGNRYMLKHANPSAHIKEQRFVLPPEGNLDEDEEDIATIREAQKLTMNNIPVEWNAWLRYTRKDPPTEQEIERNRRQKMIVLQRVEELDNKERLISGDNQELMQSSDNRTSFEGTETFGQTVQGDTRKQKFPIREGLEILPGVSLRSENTRRKNEQEDESKTKTGFKD
ncbi:NADH dehydrogenase [ubiquinone] 1 alpha subcomplex assembly factor 2-like [Dreissena polymorpha]|uniref:Mimitin, mitochondrial n=1 Tax=Dreissena polymorpha TaxID=45954 RepID=A0A9D4BHZ5_DREPO|nr:NADH dehydrogenase [ubiquinone] 1 alpha subcomplex assembly factor 2-like [Dreissena polymorpha]KAH3695692.1 hypothetical protein DPMN_083150 [Dreissena polymorpha]